MNFFSTAWASLVTTLGPFFLHPFLFAVGSVLVASPIIIHLINRVRFRKVRFAAMEFLLQAQQQNRRRLLLEQLLLLLLRILIVLAIAALIARLLLDPRLAKISGEASTHHMVVLDDSASMQNRSSRKTADDSGKVPTTFDDAKDMVLNLVQKISEEQKSSQFTLVLLSDPANPIYNEHTITDNFVKELESRLENLRSTSQRLNLQSGLEQAGLQLLEDKSSIKHLHFFSDFRKEDWKDQEALADLVERLEKDAIGVNLVRAVDEPETNLGVTTLSGDFHTAAVGKPVELTVGVTNFGDKVKENITVSLYQNGNKLPHSLTFAEIQPGINNEAKKSLSLRFQTEGLHEFHVVLTDDSLTVDNTRHLSINIPRRNKVLILQNGTRAEDLTAAVKVKDVFDSNSAETGVEPIIHPLPFLDAEDLDLSQYRTIYLVNPNGLSEEAVKNLEPYVRAGGGLVWFLGDKAKPAILNDEKICGLKIQSTGKPIRERESLFPVMLGDTPTDLVRVPIDIVAGNEEREKTPDLNFVPHPIFESEPEFTEDYEGFSVIRLKKYWPLHTNWVQDDSTRDDGVTTWGFTREGTPLAFDHRLGQGRIITFLTWPGPPTWNNLVQIGGVLVPLVMEVQNYTAMPKVDPPAIQVGEAVALKFPETGNKGTIRIFSPGSQQPIKANMTAIEEEVKPVSSSTEKSKAEPAEEIPSKKPVLEKKWSYTFARTTRPGVYRYEVASDQKNTEPLQGTFSVNVAPKEGAVEVAKDEDIKKFLPKDSKVTIWNKSDYNDLSQDPDREVRNILLIALLVLLLAEQALAYRLSYHPETAKAPA